MEIKKFKGINMIVIQPIAWIDDETHDCNNYETLVEYKGNNGEYSFDSFSDFYEKEIEQWVRKKAPEWISENDIIQHLPLRSINLKKVHKWLHTQPIIGFRLTRKKILDSIELDYTE